MYRVPLSATPFDGNAIGKVLERYRQQPVTDVVTDFEKTLTTYSGSPYVLAVSSGTAAIHLALKALGVVAGDVVVAPSSTYVATANPILYLGATPVFVDSEPLTWNMSPVLLEEALAQLKREGQSVRCVIVAHSYGLPALMDEINAICKQYGASVLEDAAAAVGSLYKGRRAGTLGDIGVYSFNNNKTITTYGGGALVTSNREIYSKTAFWASQSRENKPYYEHREIGYSYRMSPLNAAAGLIAFEHIDDKIGIRREIFSRYQERLGNSLLSTWAHEPAGFLSSRWLASCMVNGLNVRDIVSKLGALGIECRRVWNPMHRQPVFVQYRSFLSGFADKLFADGLCLPSSNVSHVDEVCQSLVRLL